jgi:hypothetical protein
MTTVLIIVVVPCSLEVVAITDIAGGGNNGLYFVSTAKVVDVSDEPAAKPRQPRLPAAITLSRIRSSSAKSARNRERVSL